jgi:hypothetical protein
MDISKVEQRETSLEEILVVLRVALTVGAMVGPSVDGWVVEKVDG